MPFWASCVPQMLHEATAKNVFTIMCMQAHFLLSGLSVRTKSKTTDNNKKLPTKEFVHLESKLLRAFVQGGIIVKVIVEFEFGHEILYSRADTCKIAQNVVKAWNFVQIKLSPCRSRIDLGVFRKFSPFRCVPICMAASNAGIQLKGKIQENDLLVFKKLK